MPYQKKTVRKTVKKRYVPKSKPVAKRQHRKAPIRRTATKSTALAVKSSVRIPSSNTVTTSFFRRDHHHRGHDHRHRFGKAMSQNFVRTHGLIPDSLVTKCIIDSDVVNTTSNTGTLGGWNILALTYNNFENPFGTFSAVRPMGYDQISQLYEDYRVVGVKVELECYTVGTTGVPMFMAVGYDEELVSIPTSISPAAVREQKNFIFRETLPGRPSYISRYLTTEKIFGVNKTQIRSDSDFQGSFDPPTAPAETGVIYIMMRTSNGTTQAYSYRVKMTLYTVFSGAKILDDSMAILPFKELCKKLSDEEKQKDDVVSEVSIDDLSKSEIKVVKQHRKK